MEDSYPFPLYFRRQTFTVVIAGADLIAPSVQGFCRRRGVYPIYICGRRHPLLDVLSGGMGNALVRPVPDAAGVLAELEGIGRGAAVIEYDPAWPEEDGDAAGCLAVRLRCLVHEGGATIVLVTTRPDAAALDLIAPADRGYYLETIPVNRRGQDLPPEQTSLADYGVQGFSPPTSPPRPPAGPGGAPPRPPPPRHTPARSRRPGR
ncbi:hypothetical protein [Methanofollis fontis]|uniref:Uncharacterized protein n=1 Tax=Methanofollis fontis TaxID=2052832 RepID=A0A483CV97_9EURY|nr:hypothetical protein [Methanofollis fontis]TAJ45411.1 hypothetical protein CUJ86_01335 [Methanofollis fontis]